MSATKSPEQKSSSELSITLHGTTQDNKQVHLFTLKNKNGLVAKISSYGCILTEMHIPDKNGTLDDVVLGFDSLDGYLATHPYFGAIVGRYANRIGGAKFSLDGKEYKVTANRAPNLLHGGLKGFDKVVWKGTAEITSEGPSVTFTYISKDGEEGFPGELKVEVVYVLSETNELRIRMAATTDKPTVCNLASHSYWNMAGHSSGDVLNHQLQINADTYTVVDDTLIPTGDIRPVKGGPLDFLQLKSLKSNIGPLKDDKPSGGGFDNNFVLNRKPNENLVLAASVLEPSSGRQMELFTNMPGVQFYSANWLDGKLKGKKGVAYNKHQGFCLETQYFPDSPNKPNFPSSVLRPGSQYEHIMIHRFSVKK